MAKYPLLYPGYKVSKKIVKNCVECVFFEQMIGWDDGHGYCHFNPEPYYVRGGSWCGRGEVKVEPRIVIKPKSNKK